VVRAFVPNRGDFVWLQFTPQAGHEQAGHRPALVVSPRTYNAASGLALMCPLTTKAKGYPFEVAVPTTGAVKGVILADQIRSLDWRARKVRRIAHAPEAVIEEVQAKLRVLLD